MAEFQDLLYQSLNRDVGTQTTAGGNLPPVGNIVGLGVKTSGIFPNVQQGTLVQTQAEFDLAIQGKGYFQVTDANGNVYYTRDGRFSPDSTGLLVNPQGYTLDPSLTIPQNTTSVTINPQGEVLATLSGATTPTNVGRITLVNFINEAGLRPEGNNLNSETDSSGTPISSNPGEQGYGTLQQGFIEASNVDAVYEITQLITAQRAYELNSKIISTADEMMQATNNAK